MSTNRRRKGIRVEIEYAKRMREIGYTKVITTREGSRLADSCGIDLMYTPILMQIKAGYRQLNHRAELGYVDTRVKEEFSNVPSMLNKPIALIHHKDMLVRGIGIKRQKFDTIVSMGYEDFEKLMLLAYPPNKN